MRASGGRYLVTRNEDDDAGQRLQAMARFLERWLEECCTRGRPLFEDKHNGSASDLT